MLVVDVQQDVPDMGGSRDENEGRVRMELALARQESADEMSFKLPLSSKTFAQMGQVHKIRIRIGKIRVVNGIRVLIRNSYDS